MPQLYDLFAPEVSCNPYPLYEKLRTQGPVYWSKELEQWLITSYEDVVSVLSDSRFTTVMNPPEANDVEKEARRQIMETTSKILSFVEPPNHTQVRGLVKKAFIPKLGGMREQIQIMVDGLLDQVQGTGRMDIVRDLADPLPFLVIAKFLGLPIEDSLQLRGWSFDLGRVIGNAPTTPDDDRLILKGLLAMNEYLLDILEQRRDKPQNDLITALLSVEEQGNRLSQSEIIANIALILAAGIGTPTYLMSTGLLTLLRNPAQMEHLKNKPVLIESAIEEFLRYESPLQWAIRRAVEDIELHGQVIGKDQLLLVGLGSANHDETAFSDPESFDINRQNNHHLAFGYGHHACLGTPLLYLQVEIAINTVLQRFSGLNLETDKLEWINTPMFRALKALPITFDT